MSKPLVRTTTLAACFALLIFCGASCRKPVNPEKLALMSEPPGPALNPAAVVKIDQPVKALPAAPAETGEPSATITGEASDKPVSANQRTILQDWLMLVGVLLLLFLLSLMLFHSLGRRLRKRTFRAHAPTRHADIWASHQPPQFLDP